MVALLSRMFSLAEEWGWRTQNTNPCHHLRLNKEKPVHNPLGDLDMEKLGKTLRAVREEARYTMAHPGTHANDKPLARDLIRSCDVIELIALTGCRRNEVVALTWPEVDLENAVLRLRDSKAGPRPVWLGAAAVELLRRQEKPEGQIHGFVFPGRTAGMPLQGIERTWRRIRSRAELPPETRLHDLRHSVGASAAASGMGQAQIGALLGHRNLATTARYTEPHRDPSARAAELVSGKIAKALGCDTANPTATASETDQDAGAGKEER
jgi:integrase